ncbi:TRAP transporter substrate-binding protein [Pseudoxanthomonas sp.]|uniref:TRAP transporter substrate-binding protein n=1 Tax=Pseudoxanthomonas sp. TaxID=1871049 RepID=UPI0025D5DD87|nr:TRAP transporter substrate-binding protein [Pseudoxanthomonas sp.]
MMNRRRFLGAGLGVAAALPMAGGRAFADEGRRVLTATDVHVKDYPTVQAVRWIGETLARETGGRVTLRQYHSGQLGRESEAIDMARFGAIDMTRVYAGALNNAFPLTQALCLPYVFDSVPHMRRAMDEGVGQAVLDGFARRGLVGLAIYDSGARCFYNTQHAIRAPADLHGLKIRVPVSDIFIRMLRLFGANPTPLSLGEVFSGLETRMIDGAENNIRSFHSSRHFEAARYWSQTNHSYAPDVLLVSQRTLDSLQRRDRDLLIDTARQSVGVMRTLWDASEAEARGAVFAAGVERNDADLSAFARASQPLLSEYRRDPAIDTLYRRIRDLA